MPKQKSPRFAVPPPCPKPRDPANPTEEERIAETSPPLEYEHYVSGPNAVAHRCPLCPPESLPNRGPRRTALLLSGGAR